MKSPETQYNLIRHAKSLANEKKSFGPNNLVKLSETGEQQALELAEILRECDLILVSKFVRTFDTALPFIEKSGTPCATHIGLHEFDYVSIKRFGAEQKTEDYEKYNEFFWSENADPYYKDFGEAESFCEFVTRIHFFLLDLEELKDKKIHIFTHNFYIKSVLILTQEFPDLFLLEQDSDEFKVYLKKIMRRFHEKDKRKECSVKNISQHNFDELIYRYWEIHLRN